MRFISSMFTKALSVCLALVLLMPCAGAVTMDDELTLGMISVKTTRLNPLCAAEREFQSLTALIYEGLYAIDDNYRPVPCLAQSCAPNATGTVWTVSMRKDACFHDGTPVTAYDVVATIEAMKMYNRIFSPVDGIVKEVNYSIGDNAVRSKALVVIEIH